MDSHGAFADPIQHRVATATHQSAYRSLAEMSPPRTQSMGPWTGRNAAGGWIYGNPTAGFPQIHPPGEEAIAGRPRQKTSRGENSCLTETAVS
jgi:hypothetical protein